MFSEPLFEQCFPLQKYAYFFYFTHVITICSVILIYYLHRLEKKKKNFFYKFKNWLKFQSVPVHRPCKLQYSRALRPEVSATTKTAFGSSPDFKNFLL